MKISLRFLFITALLSIGVAYPYGSVLDNQFFSCRSANSYGIKDVQTSRFYIPDGWSHSSDRDGDGISCEPAK